LTEVVVAFVPAAPCSPPVGRRATTLHRAADCRAPLFPPLLMPRFPRAEVAAVPPPPKGTTSTAPVSLEPPYRPRRASTPPPFAALLAVPPLPLHAARPPEPRVKRLCASISQACLAVAVGPHAGCVTVVCTGRCPGAVVGCVHCESRPWALCHWARAKDSALWYSISFFYFLNIFKSLQIQKFV
jgi:hypothetical protein